MLVPLRVILLSIRLVLILGLTPLPWATNIWLGNVRRSVLTFPLRVCIYVSSLVPRLRRNIIPSLSGPAKTPSPVSSGLLGFRPGLSERVMVRGLASIPILLYSPLRPRPTRSGASL